MSSSAALQEGLHDNRKPVPGRGHPYAPLGCHMAPEWDRVKSMERFMLTPLWAGGINSGMLLTLDQAGAIKHTTYIMDQGAYVQHTPYAGSIRMKGASICHMKMN